MNGSGLAKLLISVDKLCVQSCLLFLLLSAIQGIYMEIESPASPGADSPASPTPCIAETSVAADVVDEAEAAEEEMIASGGPGGRLLAGSEYQRKAYSSAEWGEKYRKVTTIYEAFMKLTSMGDVTLWCCTISSELSQHNAGRLSVVNLPRGPESLLELFKMVGSIAQLIKLIDTTINVLLAKCPDECMTVLFDASRHGTHFNWIWLHIAVTFPGSIVDHLFTVGADQFKAYVEDIKLKERNQVSAAILSGIHEDYNVKFNSLSDVFNFLTRRSNTELGKIVSRMIKDSLDSNPKDGVFDNLNFVFFFKLVTCSVDTLRFLITQNADAATPANFFRGIRQLMSVDHRLVLANIPYLDFAKQMIRALDMHSLAVVFSCVMQMALDPLIFSQFEHQDPGVCRAIREKIVVVVDEIVNLIVRAAHSKPNLSVVEYPPIAEFAAGKKLQFVIHAAISSPPCMFINSFVNADIVLGRSSILRVLNNIRVLLEWESTTDASMLSIKHFGLYPDAAIGVLYTNLLYEVLNVAEESVEVGEAQVAMDLVLAVARLIEATAPLSNQRKEGATHRLVKMQIRYAYKMMIQLASLQRIALSIVGREHDMAISVFEEYRTTIFNFICQQFNPLLRGYEKLFLVSFLTCCIQDAKTLFGDSDDLVAWKYESAERASKLLEVEEAQKESFLDAIQSMPLGKRPNELAHSGTIGKGARHLQKVPLPSEDALHRAHVFLDSMRTTCLANSRESNLEVCKLVADVMTEALCHDALGGDFLFQDWDIEKDFVSKYLEISKRLDSSWISQGLMEVVAENPPCLWFMLPVVKAELATIMAKFENVVDKSRRPTEEMLDRFDKWLYLVRKGDILSERFELTMEMIAYTPPTLEEFDPLNPGEWQLGAAGKILPRLPEGTRVGKLVMGKYGLYDPVLRKRVDVYSKALLEGKKSEEAGPFDRAMTRLVKFFGTLCFFMGIYNLFTLAYGKLLPPYSWL
ncbi:hypothetical protein GCK32_002284, partial [Trichostrongylus colubriformis]